MAAGSSSSPLLPIERLDRPLRLDRSTLVKAISKPALAKILNDDEHGNKLLVVEFVEPGNAACESMKPEVEKIASRFANDAVFYELDCSNFKFLTSRLKVAAVPMFLLMRNSKVEKQCDVEDIVVGVRTGELESSIEKHIRPSGSSNQDVKLIRLSGFPWMTIPLSHYRAPNYTRPLIYSREGRSQQLVPRQGNGTGSTDINSKAEDYIRQVKRFWRF